MKDFYYMYAVHLYVFYHLGIFAVSLCCQMSSYFVTLVPPSEIYLHKLKVSSQHQLIFITCLSHFICIEIICRVFVWQGVSFIYFNVDGYLICLSLLYVLVYTNCDRLEIDCNLDVKRCSATHQIAQIYAKIRTCNKKSLLNLVTGMLYYTYWCTYISVQVVQLTVL